MGFIQSLALWLFVVAGPLEPCHTPIPISTSAAKKRLKH
jgi:hypothetical protein